MIQSNSKKIEEMIMNINVIAAPMLTGRFLITIDEMKLINSRIQAILEILSGLILSVQMRDFLCNNSCLKSLAQKYGGMETISQGLLRKPSWIQRICMATISHIIDAEGALHKSMVHDLENMVAITHIEYSRPFLLAIRDRTISLSIRNDYGDFLAVKDSIPVNERERIKSLKNFEMMHDNTVEVLVRNQTRNNYMYRFYRRLSRIVGRGFTDILSRLSTRNPSPKKVVFDMSATCYLSAPVYENERDSLEQRNNLNQDTNSSRARIVDGLIGTMFIKNAYAHSSYVRPTSLAPLPVIISPERNLEPYISEYYDSPVITEKNTMRKKS